MSAVRGRLSQIGAYPVFGAFAVEAFVLGNWIPRIPDVKALYGFSAGELGLALFAISLGTLFALPFAGAIISRLGLTRGNQIANPLWALFIGLIPFAGNPWLLTPILLLAGMSVALQEVAMNTAADDIGARTGTRIMSRAHGMWSVGTLVGALVGAAFAQAGVPPTTHFAIVMPLAAFAGIIVGSGIADRVRETDEPAPTFRLPRRDMVLLCLMPIGIMLVEGAFIDWSALFARDVLNAEPLTIGLIYAAFSLVMAATRLSGDYLLDRFGALKVARVSAACASFGIAAFALSPNLPLAFLASVLAGLGVAICYPLAVEAAARRPGRAEENVAAISMVAFSSFMLAPPLIGAMADGLGLRAALLCIVPFAVVSYLLSGEVAKRA